MYLQVSFVATKLILHVYVGIVNLLIYIIMSCKNRGTDSGVYYIFTCRSLW